MSQFLLFQSTLALKGGRLRQVHSRWGKERLEECFRVIGVCQAKAGSIPHQKKQAGGREKSAMADSRDEFGVLD